MKKRYGIKIDLYSIIITTIVTLLLIVLIRDLLININNWKILALGLVLFVLILALYWFPISYTITSDEIHIQRIITKKTIKINTITNVKFAKNIVSYSYGTKGFLGYLGKTMDGTISFSTHFKYNLLIKTHDASFLISPLHLKEFYEELQKKIKR